MADDFVSSCRRAVLASGEWAALMETVVARAGLPPGTLLDEAIASMSAQDRAALLARVEAVIADPSHSSAVARIIDERVAQECVPEAMRTLLAAVPSQWTASLVKAEAWNAQVDESVRGRLWEACVTLDPTQEARFQGKWSSRGRAATSRPLAQAVCDVVGEAAALSVTVAGEAAELWCVCSPPPSPSAATDAMYAAVGLLAGLSGPDTHSLSEAQGRCVWALASALSPLPPSFSDSVLAHLQVGDPRVHAHISRVCGAASPLPPSSASRLFAGVVPAEVCVHIVGACVCAWPDPAAALAKMCAALVHCCRADVLRAASCEGVRVGLRAACATLTMPLLQAAVRAMFRDGTSPAVAVVPRPPEGPRPSLGRPAPSTPPSIRAPSPIRVKKPASPVAAPLKSAREEAPKINTARGPEGKMTTPRQEPPLPKPLSVEAMQAIPLFSSPLVPPSSARAPLSARQDKPVPSSREDRPLPSARAPPEDRPLPSARAPLTHDKPLPSARDDKPLPSARAPAPASPKPQGSVVPQRIESPVAASRAQSPITVTQSPKRAGAAAEQSPQRGSTPKRAPSHSSGEEDADTHSPEGKQATPPRPPPPFPVPLPVASPKPTGQPRPVSKVAAKLLEGLAATSDRLTLLFTGGETNGGALADKVTKLEDKYTEIRAKVQQRVFGGDVSQDTLALLPTRRKSEFNRKGQEYNSEFLKEWVAANPSK